MRGVNKHYHIHVLQCTKLSLYDMILFMFHNFHSSAYYLVGTLSPFTLSYSNSNYDLFCRKAQKKGQKLQVKYLKTSKENIIEVRNIS